MPSTSEDQRNVLQAARDRSRDYSSESTREDLVTAFKKAFHGLEPYDWQLDVTEALFLGLDCVVIAGTGSGKTMPFAMPLLVDKTKKKMVIVISPLNDLEEDQARRFKDIGLTATAVNGDVWNDVLQEEIVNAKHQVIFTSPEMCLYHPSFSKLMRSADFTKNVCMIAIDEAHCISQWGNGFRKAFGELGRLRSFVSTSVPILATSATLQPLVLCDIQSQLHLSVQETFLVNLGNHRANITNILVPMRTANDFGALDFLADEAYSGRPLRRTIIFFNTRDLAYKGSQYLKQLVPEAYRNEINFLHAGRNRRARRKVLRDFRKGEINILCATEAAGMGMDIPDIDCVVQFMVALSLSILIQRFGRAGRSGQPVIAVLLAEPSVFQVKKKNDVTKLVEVNIKEEPIDNLEDDIELSLGALSMEETDVEYRKKVEVGMQDWCLTLGCRCDVSDKYFNNPPRPNGASFGGVWYLLDYLALLDPAFPLCCDNCLRRRREDPGHILTDAESNLLALIDRIQTQLKPSTSKSVIDVDDISAENSKRQGLGSRRTDRLQSCRTAIIEWRSRTWSENYSDCAWGPTVLLPDAIVTKLATRSHILTVEDIKREVPDWDFVIEYGTIILDLIQKTDDLWKEDHACKLKANKDTRKQRTIENKQHREEERRVKKQAETAQRKSERTWINAFAQPSFFPGPLASTSSHPYSQPIFFVPGYPQM